VSVTLLDTVGDGGGVAVLSAVGLAAVDEAEMVDEPAEDAAADPEDDDAADELGVEADALGELVAVSAVAVASVADCSGAASRAWADGTVASAVASKTGTMAIAARMVRIASTAAAAAPDRALRRARPTAITTSEHRRPHPVRRPPIGISIRPAAHDAAPTHRRRHRSTQLCETLARRRCECRKPQSPFEVVNGDGHSIVSFWQSHEMPSLSYWWQWRPDPEPGETFATVPTTGMPVLAIMNIAILPRGPGELSTSPRVRFLSRRIQ
jgi:hypothetical protein